MAIIVLLQWASLEMATMHSMQARTQITYWHADKKLDMDGTVTWHTSADWPGKS